MLRQRSFLTKLGVLVAIVTLSGIIASCGGKSATNTPSAAPTGSPSGGTMASPTPTPTPTADLIKQRVDKMTLDEKIGQLVLVGLEGTEMQAQTKEMIEKHRVTGFILYKNNITSSSQTLQLLNQLKETNQKDAWPLWLSVDQEGGKVDRMPEPLIKLPTALDVGRVNKPAYSYAIGQALGEEVRALGFNMNFAPVLDVNSNPNNPVIGNRSFGSEPEAVIQHGIQVMKGIQSTKVVPVVKHFPGHGDTSVDSHLDLPVIRKTLDELRAFELKPFAEAIRQQTDVVMIGHLLLPQIDETNPASLSGKVITDLLRKEMKFDGVVITDDMTMGGITKHNHIGEAAVKSVLAGADILLVGHDYEQQILVLQTLKKRVEDGTVSEKRLDESVYRIAKLKVKYGLKDTLVTGVDVNAVNRSIEAALDSGKKK